MYKEEEWPKDKIDTRLFVRATREQKAKAKELAEKTGYSLSEYIREAIKAQNQQIEMLLTIMDLEEREAAKKGGIGHE